MIRIFIAWQERKLLQYSWTEISIKYTVYWLASNKNKLLTLIIININAYNSHIYVHHVYAYSIICYIELELLPT